jgi:DNA polymerase sigma
MARLQTAESELIAGWSNNEILLHELYGSLCVGLGSSSSDIDLALLMQDATAQLWAHLHSREILAKVKKAYVSAVVCTRMRHSVNGFFMFVQV